MLKNIRMDLKRLTRSKTGIVLCLLSPIAALLCFSVYLAPVFFETGAGFEAVIFNEDQDRLTYSIIQSLTDSENGRGVITLYTASTLKEGKERLQKGAACLIHIPSGFQDTLKTGRQSVITFYKNTAKPLQSAIIYDVLSSGAKYVNEAQSRVNALYGAIALNAGKEAADRVYASASRDFMLAAINKNVLFTTETLSPLGAFLPVEYYAASFMIIFLSLSSLGLFALTSSDIKSGVMQRRISAGDSLLIIVFPRIVSGACFICAIGLPILLSYLPVCLSSFVYGGNTFLMPLCLITLSFFVSSLAFLISVSIKNMRMALLLLLCLLATGGAFIPVASFGLFSEAARFTPFSGALHMTLRSFFFYEIGSFWEPWLTTLIYALGFWAAGVALFRRKAWD